MSQEAEAATEEKSEGDKSSAPGTIGAAIDIVNSKPFTALLGPAFTEIGKYWGESAKDWADAKRNRRIENVKAHHEAVAEKSGIGQASVSSEPSVRQMEALEEWAKTAGSVDPEKDGELGALWQGLLSGIYSNQAPTEEMLTALKSFTREDAKALLEIDSSPGGRSLLDFFVGRTDSLRSRPRLEKLERLGVLTRYGWPDLITSSLLFIWILCLIMYSFIEGYVQFLTNSKFFNAETALMASYRYIPLVIAAIYTTSSLARVGSYQLTDLGRALRDSASPFMEHGGGRKRTT